MYLLRTLTILAVIIFVIAPSINGEFPDDPKPCKHGDLECIVKLTKYFLNEKYQGDDSINLQELDPLEIKKIRIKQGESSPVNVDLVFSNSSIFGIGTSSVEEVVGFGKELPQNCKLVLRIPVLTMIGDYKIDGKILILPIKGEGKSNITFVDNIISMDFIAMPKDKDGSTFMQIDKINLDVDPKRTIYKIDNLFNGDKILGDNMNLFLNENWKDIYREVRESIGSSLGSVFKKIVNKVFAKYPYEKYFLE